MEATEQENQIPQEVQDTDSYDEFLSIDMIRENPDALRIVNTETDEFACLVQSIKEQGVINPVVVREIKQGDELFYGLIDGAHRFTASKIAGKDTIPARIKSMEDGQVWLAQIIANTQRIATKRAEYARNIVRIITSDASLTVPKLAGQLGVSTTWLYQQMNLTKLHQNIQSLVDKGDITFSNAFALSKLPVEEQLDHLEDAQTMNQEEFSAMVHARAKEIRDARQAGKKEGPPEYQHRERLRKLPELIEMLETAEAQEALITACGVESPQDCFVLGLQYAISSDPITMADREEEFNQKQEKKKAEADIRKAKKADAAAASAAEKATKARDEAEKAKAEIQG